MKLEAKLEVDGKLLTVTISGNWSFNAARHLVKLTFDTALEERASLILADCLGMESTLTTLDRFKLGTELQNYPPARRMPQRIAVVGNPPAVDGFAALVASNRGVWTKVFTNHHQALDWLTAKNRSPIQRSA